MPMKGPATMQPPQPVLKYLCSPIISLYHRMCRYPRHPQPRPLPPLCLLWYLPRQNPLRSSMILQNLFKMSGSLAFLLHHRKNEDFPEIPIIIIKSPPCPPWTTTDYSDRQRYRWILHPYRYPCRLLRHYIPEVKLMLLAASIFMNTRHLILNFLFYFLSNLQVIKKI